MCVCVNKKHRYGDLRKKEIGLARIRTHEPCGTNSPSKRKFRQSSDYTNRAFPEMDAEKS